LVAAGQLRVVDASYKIGSPGRKGRAMIYAAEGDLLILVSQAKKPSRVSLEPLPTLISDGDWSNSLWKAAEHFRNGDLETFLVWVKTIPGWDKKPKRIEQAKAAYKNRQPRRKL
jgi:hypothetical protein